MGDGECVGGWGWVGGVGGARGVPRETPWADSD